MLQTRNRNKNIVKSHAGVSTLLVIALVACLLAGIAAGVTVRIATGQRRPHRSGGSTLPRTGSVSDKDGDHQPVHDSTPPGTVPPSTQPVNQPPPGILISFDGTQAMAHVKNIAGIGIRQEGSRAEARAADYIKARLSEYGYMTSVQVVPIGSTGRTQNVIATLNGTQRPQRTIVIGAHMDSKGGPGANDNATGCSVLLELARVLKNNNLLVPNVQFVFFGGEEIVPGGGKDDHHWGSRYFVKTLTPADKAAIAGMISVDMVGAGDRFLANNMGASRQTLRDYMLELGKSRGIAYRRESGMSDHEPFERAGIPSVWLEYREPPHYHGPGDTADTVNSAHVQAVGQMLQEFFEGYLTPQRVDQL